MGYYIRINQSTFTIKAEHIDEAFAAVKALNSRNELKTGGMSRKTPRPADSVSVGTPEKWFAWMEWNYDETCDTLTDILEALGFECDTEENGNITIDWYNSKSGNEDVFLEALAPFSEGAIEWVGECGEHWITGVANGRYFNRIVPEIDLDPIIAEEESR